MAAQCGATSVEFDVDAEFPLVSLVTMLGPSPDWFVGVSGLSLRENDRWVPQIVVELRPFDAGTRSANQWRLYGPENIPPEPIQQISDGETHLVGPATLGTMTFTLVVDSRLDCDGNGTLDVGDLACMTADTRDDTLGGLNLIAGDLNAMSGVEFNDFLIFSSNFGEQGGGYQNGDIDVNGVVDFVDFLVLSNNFSHSTAASVPEPAMNGVLLVAGFLLALRIRCLRRLPNAAC